MKSNFFFGSKNKLGKKHVEKVIEKIWVQIVPSTVKVGGFNAPLSTEGLSASLVLK